MRVYKIAGNEVIATKNSLTITDKLNERTNCSFSIYEPSFEVTKGMDVLITQDGNTIFAGKVFKAKVEGYFDKTVNITSVDYSSMLDKRLIAEAYENTLAGDIVKDFINKYFSEEGIIEGTIQDGPTISKAVFNYEDGNTSLNYIADLIGYYWEIDKDKKLNFFDKSTYIAPFNITYSSNNYKDLKSEEDSSQYRNRQYTRGGTALSTTQTRTFKGDRETQTWAVDLPIAEVPTISVNSTFKTVGIRGVETGKDFYWQKNDKSISQDSTGTKLTDTDVLTIEFKGYYPVIVVADNASEIESRKSIEGGSGIYENVTEEKNLDNQDAALQYTDGLLEKYGFIPKVVNFNTTEDGLKAGQLINIEHTKQNISGSFLIEKVTSRADGSLMLYSIKCLDGNNIGGWENFFKRLVKKQEKLTIRENEIVLKLLTFKDSFLKPTMTDEITYNLHQYLICNTTTICGEDVII
jgi:hypothetical protein